MNANERPSPQRDLQVLRERASLLAREEAAHIEASLSLEIVEFELAAEHYGFELTHVREVSLLKELVPLPCTPAFVAGIVNLRGEMLSVLDLRHLFDLPVSSEAGRQSILVLDYQDRCMGVLADFIHGVRYIAKDAIQASLPTLTGIRSAYLQGVTAERLILLDATKILSDRQIIVYEEVESAVDST